MNRRKGIDLARQALRSAPDDSDVLTYAPLVLGFFGEDIEVALGMIDRSLTINPNFARGWFFSGVLKLYVGQPDVALEHFETFMRLSPLERLPFYLTGIGAALFFKQQFNEALAKLLESLIRFPNFVLTYRLLASTYAHIGQLDDAREMVARLRTITPVVVPNVTPFRNLEYRELFLSGLRLAAGEMA